MAKYKIDATDKILGRLATEVALLLRGKDSEKFLPHIDSGNSVEVTNIKKVKVSGNKFEKKLYRRYSGYPGGLKEIAYKDLVQKDAGEVLRQAVHGMLPNNKLRARQLKRLIIL